jgi:small subunit ribosomal protein S26
MRSLRAFMREESMEKRQIQADKATPADEMAEFDRCFKLNEEWNEELRKKREIRVISENERRREEILMSLERHDKRLKEKKIQIEEKVKEVMKEVSEVVLTQDKVDGAIEKALASVSHFDYAIDLQGNVYKNRQLVQKEEIKSET